MTTSQNSFWLYVIYLFTIVWVLPWKGYALWTASRMGKKWWFIALLITDTFAILDIFFIFYVAKISKKEIKRVLKSKI